MRKRQRACKRSASRCPRIGFLQVCSASSEGLQRCMHRRKRVSLSYLGVAGDEGVRHQPGKGRKNRRHAQAAHACHNLPLQLCTRRGRHVSLGRCGHVHCPESLCTANWLPSLVCSMHLSPHQWGERCMIRTRTDSDQTDGHLLGPRSTTRARGRRSCGCCPCAAMPERPGHQSAPAAPPL